jgi:hypothetical protein
MLHADNEMQQCATEQVVNKHSCEDMYGTVCTCNHKCILGGSVASLLKVNPSGEQIFTSTFLEVSGIFRYLAVLLHWLRA